MRKAKLLEVSRAAFRAAPIRTLVSLILFSFVLYHIDRTDLIESILSVDPLYFLLACGAFAAGQTLNSVRWKMLVTSISHVRLRIIDLFWLNLVGMYYNFFAPSTIGGDVLQAETAKRYIGGRVPSYVSIILNRILALFAVVVIAVFCIMLGAVLGVTKNPIFVYIAFGLLILIIVTVPSVIYFRRWVANPGVSKRRSPLWAQSTRECILQYFEQRGVILRVFWLAIISNLIGQVLVVWIISEGFAVGVRSFEHFFIVPIIILVTLIPITLNGIGLREAAFVYFYGTADVAAADAVAMSVVFTGMLVAFGLVGGLATLSPRYRLYLE